MSETSVTALHPETSISFNGSVWKLTKKVASWCKASDQHQTWIIKVYLIFKRRSLPTISPSFRHPLVVDLSNTSQSLLSIGSFNRLIFVDLSKVSDIAASKERLPSVSTRADTLDKCFDTNSLLPGRHDKSVTPTVLVFPHAAVGCPYTKDCVCVENSYCALKPKLFVMRKENYGTDWANLQVDSNVPQ